MTAEDRYNLMCDNFWLETTFMTLENEIVPDKREISRRTFARKGNRLRTQISKHNFPVENNSLLIVRY